MAPPTSGTLAPPTTTPPILAPPAQVLHTSAPPTRPPPARAPPTLHECSMSVMALRLRLAVAITSSCRQELPAATALAVAMVIPLVMRMNSSGAVVFGGGSELLKTCGGRGRADELPGAGRRGPCRLTASSCLMCSMVASRALVPLVASSSTAFTVFRSDVTLVTITCGIGGKVGWVWRRLWRWARPGGGVPWRSP